MRGKAVQALSAVAAVFVLIALFTPLWSVSGPFGYSSEIRLSYIDILDNVGQFPSFSGGRSSAADFQAATGLMLIIISAFCALLTLVLSAVSAASKKGTGVAAASLSLPFSTHPETLSTTLSNHLPLGKLYTQ